MSLAKDLIADTIRYAGQHHTHAWSHQAQYLHALLRYLQRLVLGSLDDSDLGRPEQCLLPGPHHLQLLRHDPSLRSDHSPALWE